MRPKDFEPMQDASRQQVNAEEMLAELKRVVESSTPSTELSVALCIDGFQVGFPHFGDRGQLGGEWAACCLSKGDHAHCPKLETGCRRACAGGRSLDRRDL